MKELAIYFTNLKRLLDMDEALRVVSVEEIPSYLVTALYAQNPNIYDYSVNLASSAVIQQLGEQGLEISRLYFGGEFCQNLIVSPDDLEQAYYFSRQLGWNFTYVTGGSNTEVGMEKIRKNLAKLHELDPESEVVVNDWGLIHVMEHEYPSFHLVLGRILNKQTRLNLFATKGQTLPIFTGGLETSKEQLMQNQLAAYADVSLSNPDYLEAVKSWGFTGADFDMVPQGVIRPEDGWGLTMGYYFPWTFIATGRNCPTAGVKDPARTLVMTDRPCGHACQRYNCSPNLIQFEVPLVQRGTTLFISTEDFAAQNLRPDANYERLIYEPYIPL